VIQLCRNCHWELDHGLIELEKWSRLGSNQHTPVTHLTTA
jgi:hypothetical protein